MRDAVPVDPPVNLNFKFPIGPCRTPLKPYNHVDCVKEVAVWTKRTTAVQRLKSYHKQSCREAKAHKSMPSSRKQTPPRSSNRKVQKHLNAVSNMMYHRSNAAKRVPLATKSGVTEVSDCKRYLRNLSQGNRQDQKVLAVLKDRVREDASELFDVRNLLAKYDPTSFFPSRNDLHAQQTFGTNNELKSYTVLPVVSQIAVIIWKLGYLSADNDENLAKALPCGEATLSIMSDLARVDFSALKLLPLDHDIYDNPKKEALNIVKKSPAKYMLSLIHI